MAHSFDVVVIGGGPGGYVAAIRASQLGKKVALVEANHLGGICLNWGCIPTKALLRVSELYHTMTHADAFGLSVEGVSFDIKKIVERSRGVASQLSGGIGHLMKKNKIEVFDGFGALNGKGKVKVDKDGERIADLEAKTIILATGARARRLPGVEYDGKTILTYKEEMIPETMPKSLLVIGSGAIGTEFASFYNDLGVKVTLAEMAPRILPVEDAEISAIAHKAFTARGMDIRANAKVENLRTEDGNAKATITIDGKAEECTFDRAIVAIGIVANTENLGLDGTGVAIEKGFISVDEYLQTGENGVYAIGDVTPGPWLAHKASHEGVIAAEHLSGNHAHPMKRQNIPGCTYCNPQIASVGLTEAAAKEAGHDIKVGKFPYVGNGKAIAMGETEGLIKTIFDKATGELLGAHMIGAEVTEMISSFLVGKTAELTEEDFMHTIFPHPTMSEMLHESVLGAYDRALHM